MKPVTTLRVVEAMRFFGIVDTPRNRRRVAAALARVTSEPLGSATLGCLHGAPSPGCPAQGCWQSSCRIAPLAGARTPKIGRRRTTI